MSLDIPPQDQPFCTACAIAGFALELLVAVIIVAGAWALLGWLMKAL